MEAEVGESAQSDVKKTRPAIAGFEGRGHEPRNTGGL